MSEEYPLLCEDSDDDKFGPHYQRPRFSCLKGRARSKVKGAAVIMRRWPEHWSTILTYWWVGFAMIALTTFVIYNSMFSIGMIETANVSPSKYANFNSILRKTEQTLPNIYMHVLINEEETDYSNYMPYIEVFANKYKDFAFNLIVVANDTNEEASNVSDETNNNIALNSLWTPTNYHHKTFDRIFNNINIKHVTLSSYFNDSPLKKNWKYLPHQFIPFLMRAISVWDKGGIAINPSILTPQSPHGAYMEKFVTIMKNFKLSGREINAITEQEMLLKNHQISPRVNNIRDIINNMEQDTNKDNSLKEVLHAEESVNVVAHVNTESIPFVENDKTSEQDINLNKKQIRKRLAADSENRVEEPSKTQNEKNYEYQNRGLPLFLEYLFHKKNNNSNDRNHFIKKRKSIAGTDINKMFNSEDSKNLQVKNLLNDIDSDNYKPMIVSATGISDDDVNTISTKATNQDDNKIFEITVDLKGNLMATGTPCHAFLGNLFINTIHHSDNESITDFIIKELSIFCKGLLTSCMGIDIMLV